MLNTGCIKKLNNSEIALNFKTGIRNLLYLETLCSFSKSCMRARIEFAVFLTTHTHLTWILKMTFTVHALRQVSRHVREWFPHFEIIDFSILRGNK